MTTTAYLTRLGLEPGLPPTHETLVAVQRAHLQQVPYENLAIMLGRPPSVRPADSLDRVATVGRAGYCFHQNGVLEVVLQELGFAVERRHGHVWTAAEHRDATDLNHFVLTVSGLPTDANPDGRWWPDLGLGEGFLDPLPLVAGTYDDGPFTFVIDAVRADGWSFANDPSGSFAGMEARSLPIDDDVVRDAHGLLSTPPEGRFTKVLVVQRRDPDGSDTVRCCVATRIDAGGRRATDLTTYDDWRGALDAIGLPLDDIDDGELRGLFERMLASHRAWDEAGRP